MGNDIMIRNSPIRFVFLVFLLGLAFSPRARGQFPSVRQLAKEGHEKLPVDYATFATDSAGIVRLEVYYQVFNYVLQFQKIGDLFEAKYEMSVTVKDKKGKQLAASTQEGKVKVISDDQATSWSNYRTKQLNFRLPSGKYKLKLTLRDKNTKTVLTRDLDVKLENRIGRLPTLSDIELVQFAGKRQESAESFAKGDLTLVPSVTGSFGGNEDNRLLYYLEIYRGRDMTERVRMETVLRKAGRKMVYRDSLTALLSESSVRQFRQVSLSDFLPGDYELEVVLKGRRNKKLDSRHKEFRIAWSAEAVLKHDYEAAMEQLAYIASRDEIKALKKQKTLEERIKAFDEFWLEHDPTPGTPENELKTEFYHRVSIANQRFTIMRRDGWRTDRGRIYIQYGEPDQIDDYPVAAGGQPYQQWHYYRYGPYRKFTFVDEHEDGDYRLQFPYDGLNQRPDF